jgi:hypothetical protein
VPGTRNVVGQTQAQAKFGFSSLHSIMCVEISRSSEGR